MTSFPDSIIHKFFTQLHNSDQLLLWPLSSDTEWNSYFGISAWSWSTVNPHRKLKTTKFRRISSIYTILSIFFFGHHLPTFIHILRLSYHNNKSIRKIFFMQNSTRKYFFCVPHAWFYAFWHQNDFLCSQKCNFPIHSYKKHLKITFFKGIPAGSSKKIFGCPSAKLQTTTDNFFFGHKFPTTLLIFLRPGRTEFSIQILYFDF